MLFIGNFVLESLIKNEIEHLVEEKKIVSLGVAPIYRKKNLIKYIGY